MAGYHDFYKQISSGSSVSSGFSLVTDSDALAIINSCRNRNLDLFTTRRIPGSMAFRAFIPDHLSSAAAFRTSLDITDRAEHRLLCIGHLTGSVTLTASLRRSARFCTCSMAGLTGVLESELYLFVTAE